MRVLLIEPYYGGSHQAWVDGYCQHTQHDIIRLTLPAQFWKWRMQGGAVSIARMIDEQDIHANFILVSGMIDLANLRALTHHRTATTPFGLYFHETQLTYPQNSRQSHGWRYGFINYISALTADAVYFNSQYHLDIFLETLPKMLKHFADYNELQTVDKIRAKSSVLPLGLDLKRFDAHQPVMASHSQPPLILWNHRWEEDKNPQAFINALYHLMKNNIDFRVAIVGENPRQAPTEFHEARPALGERLVHFGYLPDFASYARLLWQADYVVSTANQEFFGGAVVEAMYCGCIPILPDRLNYPYLLPQSLQDACLYKGNGLAYKLMAHLRGDYPINTADIQAYISRYDWSIIAPGYDSTFADLAGH